MASPARPAWQTDDLEDEWIDNDEEDDNNNDDEQNGSQSMSLSMTTPGTMHIINASIHDGDSDGEPTSDPDAGGTFLVRQDIPAVPFTPGHKKKLGAINTFFSPLPLERMFEPPSPPPIPNKPAISSRLVREYVPTASVTDDGEQSSHLDAVHEEPEPIPNHPFTFTVPRQSSLGPGPGPVPTLPQAQSTPLPPLPPGPMAAPPMTDPRLKLFHFQYDTFTRDHLSAIVDSIPVNRTPSAGSGLVASPSVASGFGSSPGFGSELMAGGEQSISHLRSAKRMRLSPHSDFSPQSQSAYGEGDGEGASIARPKHNRDLGLKPRLAGADYVGESRRVMEAIRSARDFSTVSTSASAARRRDGEEELGQGDGNGEGEQKAKDAVEAQIHAPAHPRPTLLTVPPLTRPSSSLLSPTSPNPLASSTGSGTSTSRLEKYSSLAYRKQAADLMAAIKGDVGGRSVSGETDVSVGGEGNATTTRRGKENGNGEGTERDKEKEKEGKEKERRGHTRGVSSTSTVFTKRSHNSPARPTRSPRKVSSASANPRRVGSGRLRKEVVEVVVEDLAGGVQDMSIDDQQGTLARGPGRGTVRRSSNPVPPPQPQPQPQPQLQAGLLQPMGSLRGTEDLTRFVSSSTAMSGATLTTQSAGSFVKHPGPGSGAGGVGGMRRIGPEEVQGMLGDRVGRMVFDRVMMRWVKSVDARAQGQGADLAGEDKGWEEEKTERNHARGMSMESEDPFRDIESLREDVTGREAQASEDAMSRITETEREDLDAQGDDEDGEEMELNSFSFDGPSAGVVHIMTGVDTTDVTTDSDSQDDGLLVTETDHEHEQDLGDGFDSDEEFALADNETVRPPLIAPTWGSAPRASPGKQNARHATSPARPKHAMSPLRHAATPRSPKSVMKSRSTTPLSALKGGSGPRGHRTPANRMGHRRSVSFSDGKREGPIKGVNRVAGDATEQRSIAFVPSARSKRIADMMDDLESSEFVAEESPTKSSASSRRPSQELRPMRRPSSSAAKQDVSHRVFSRSQTQRQSSDGAGPSHVNANATFLTECSFGVSHDRLVQIITDVEPFEPYWENIGSIDLSKKNVESVARLKEFLPKLDALSLNSNRLEWLSGVPGGVRTLSVASNCLTGLTSYSHLLNLENLDLSHNDIDCLRQLECLHHLRELRADGNKITSLDGLQQMDGLVKLSLQQNGVTDVDLASYHWTRLEMLNLSGNKVNGIDGLASLPSLISLNIDNNSLGDLEPGGPMGRLRILRVSGNRLRRLNVASFPNLRTLYADNNALTSLVKADRLTKLENLSLRNQSGKGFHLSTRDIRDVKRLYLSGNGLQGGFIEEPCYNLVYLELAACRLSTLPANMALLAPNLRVLNLNYNFINDVQPLEGLTRLKKLTLIGSRLAGTKPLLRVLERMGDVEMLDVRMNPCTLGWYLPLLVRDVPGALQPSEGGGVSRPNGGGKDLGWKDLDSKFRRDLPDESYVGRLAYRGLVMRACPRVRMLDGIDVTEKERLKAGHLLEGISKKRKGGAVVATR